jgi:hypothetical protein
LRTGESVAFAVEEAAETSDHAYHGIERWWFIGRWFALADQVYGLPFFVGEHGITRHLGAVTPEHRQVQDAPGNDHVERQSGFESLAFFQLQVFDVATAF